jgi:hypothetical protein
MAYERRTIDAKVEHCCCKPTSFGKKMLITGGLAFLSACTVRYWLDKIEPVIEWYKHPSAYSEPASKYADIDEILQGGR